MNPEVLEGQPCIRGMPIMVGMMVEALGAGRSIDDLLADSRTWKSQTFAKPWHKAMKFACGANSEKELATGAVATLTWSDQLRVRLLALR